MAFCKWGTSRGGAMSVVQPRHATLSGAACLVLIVGCSSSNTGRMAVTGTIRLDGQPLAHGSIVLIPVRPTRGPSVAAKVKEGAFDLPPTDGPAPGTYRVEIRGDVLSQMPYDISDPREYLKHGPPRLPPDPIPSRYNSQSELEITVSADGGNAFVFDLTSGNDRSRAATSRIRSLDRTNS